MTTKLTADSPSKNRGTDIVECELCGTRLRRNEEADVMEIGTELLTTIAQHRCAPRVRSREEGRQRLDAAPPPLPIGTAVEVRGRFLGSWARGFQVAEATEDGYSLRRMADDYVLPARFVARDVRCRS